MARRVVVTGRGVVHPGAGIDGMDIGKLIEEIYDGRSSASNLPSDFFKAVPIEEIRKAEYSDKGTSVALPHGFVFKRENVFDVGFSTDVFRKIYGNAGELIKRKNLSRSDPFIIFSAAAVFNAVVESFGSLEGLGEYYKNLSRRGISLGTAFGPLYNQMDVFAEYARNGSERTSPFTVTRSLADSGTGLLASGIGAMGPSQLTIRACATSSTTIGDMFRLIRDGYVDMGLAGGSDFVPHGKLLRTFTDAGAINSKSYEDPAQASRPFAADRNGFVPCAEAAGYVILERLDSALERGAKIYGEILGYGATNDATGSPTDPNETGQELSMLLALEDANVETEEIGYVNAHGTATLANDRTETAAIRAVFGDYANEVVVNSTKGNIGHAQGAAGAIEAIIALAQLERGRFHHTLNLESGVAEECGGVYHVIGKPIERNIDFGMSNSFGVGGQNATLVLGKYN